MNYDEILKEKIAAMLREPTGVHFLDSGSAYGRHWERNRGKNFEEENACMVSIQATENGIPCEIIVYYNLYRYLLNFLSLDRATGKLNGHFKRFVCEKESQEIGWLGFMELFLKEELKQPWEIQNSYNYDNLLSQVIRFGLFEWRNGDYVILQIHNGCDVRGGYTAPYIFRVNDVEDFLMAQATFDAVCSGRRADPRQLSFEGMETSCICGNRWSSFDAGGSYLYRGCSEEIKNIASATRYDAVNRKLMCRDCGGEVVFSVMESSMS